MWKEYKVVFEKVQASGKLRTEVMNMSKQERTTPRRHIPRAAVIAAVLVLALAGTAVAQSLGWVELQPIENIFDSGKQGYHVRGDAGFVQLESLPQEVLDRAVEVGTTGTDLYGFDSWAEAEKFLGLELADNPKLQQMQRKIITYTESDQTTVQAPCILTVGYSEKALQCIGLYASYMEEGYLFSETAFLYTEAFLEDQDLDYVGYYGSYQGDTAVEEYVTPNGLAVTIATESWQKLGTNHSNINAYFLKNNAHFRIRISFDDAPSDYERNLAEAMALMKEILDAYE